MLHGSLVLNNVHQWGDKARHTWGKTREEGDKTLKTCVNKDIAGTGPAEIHQCHYFTLFQGLHSLQVDCTTESLERTLSLLIFFGIREDEEFLVYKVSEITIVKAQ